MVSLGSLFDGIGGFPLAGERYGITPLWASEIEAFPIAVTKRHFPHMLHVGDITKLDGAALPPVDIICGGSPCQDLSVAGRRAGLEGARSGLFMEQIRMIREMRNADIKRGRTGVAVRPRYGIWENVPGAFSSGTPKGEDFRIVLEEFCRIADGGLSVPRPESGRWESAGCILGEEFSVAWRVYDAQYWGVPQRRRRIYLVADFAGDTAPKILFEQHRLLGDSPPSRGERQGAAAPAQGGAGDAGKIDLDNRFNQQQVFITDTPPVCFNPFQSAKFALCYAENLSPTLRAGCATAVTQPMVFENHRMDCRYNGPLEVAPSILACYGTGGNNQSLVSQPKVFCLVGNCIDRQPHNGGNGTGVQENIAYTITATDRHAIYREPMDLDLASKCFCQSQFANYAEGVGTLRAQGGDNGGGSENLVVSSAYQKVVGALCKGDEKGIGNQYVSQDKCILMPTNLVRRLTPLECERLQGFPDGWTDIGTPAKSTTSQGEDEQQSKAGAAERRLQGRASDSARYKALGNSVAIPCVEHVLRGVSFFLRSAASPTEA